MKLVDSTHELEIVPKRSIGYTYSERNQIEIILVQEDLKLFCGNKMLISSGQAYYDVVHNRLK